MILTNEIFESGKSKKGGWTRSQLQILGVEWPIKKGWKYKIINTDMPTWKIKIFLGLKDYVYKKEKEKKQLKMF